MDACNHSRIANLIFCSEIDKKISFKRQLKKLPKAAQKRGFSAQFECFAEDRLGAAPSIAGRVLSIRMKCQ